mmetsp:Transcript_46526/g.124954  ORF Transcript_46526/g.124954 Transcript_46526/m.124954 type:complete len:227 (-) Transcript_46526:776-1456(-)
MWRTCRMEKSVRVSALSGLGSSWSLSAKMRVASWMGDSMCSSWYKDSGSPKRCFTVTLRSSLPARCWINIKAFSRPSMGWDAKTLTSEPGGTDFSISSSNEANILSFQPRTTMFSTLSEWILTRCAFESMRPTSLAAIGVGWQHGVKEATALLSSSARSSSSSPSTSSRSRSGRSFRLKAFSLSEPMMKEPRVLITVRRRLLSLLDKSTVYALSLQAATPARIACG